MVIYLENIFKSLNLSSKFIILCIADAVLTANREYTECKFNDDLAKFLKYAPERVGGRKERE